MKMYMRFKITQNDNYTSIFFVSFQMIAQV